MRFPVLTLLVVLMSCSSTPSVDSAPDSWQLPLLNGGSTSLSALTQGGKNAVVVFWQPWCGSCIAEMPDLVEAATRYKGQLSFIGVVSGPNDSVDEALIREIEFQQHLNYGTARDRELSLTRSFGVKATPSIYVLDAAGQVLYFGHEAPSNWANLLP